jgi:cystathionine beta-lyase
MIYDFDKFIERRGTHSSKWDAMAERVGVTAEDAIPMWVAEMDFEGPQEVREALAAEVERLTFGYYTGDITWRQAMSDWLDRHHGWQIDPDWVTPTPGVCSGLALAIQAFSDEGDTIVVFSPVYHAFYTYIDANDRQAFSHQMSEENGRYRMDLDRLEETLPDNAKMVFFCSPHNPGGTVWHPEEIRALCGFCERHDLILVADEIHHDLVYPGNQHHVTQMVAPGITDRLITCAGATKTFNLAGAHVGGAVIANEKLRRKFRKMAKRSGLLSYSLPGMVATEAAQRHGDEWLSQLLPYLEKNRDLFEAGIQMAIPGARAMHLEATYLSWVDFSGTGLKREDFMSRIGGRARIAASPGPVFGPGGETFVRFNFATPRSRVEEAVARLGEAFADIG